MEQIRVQVGFSVSKSLQSRVVRWITRSEVSHAFFIVSDSFLGKDMVFESDVGGVQLKSLRTLEKKNKIVRIVDMPFAVVAGLEKASDWLGEPYDYSGFFGAVVPVIGRWLKRRWKNPLNSRAKFCSEFVVRVLKMSGYPGAAMLDPSGTDPNSLYVFLLASENSR